MRSYRHVACLLIAALVLVPGVARARQKLDRRPDLKPAASFRDVDRPPKPVLDPLDLTAPPQTCQHSAYVRDSYTILNATEQPLARTAADRRCQTLRAPPAATLV